MKLLYLVRAVWQILECWVYFIKKMYMFVNIFINTQIFKNADMIE